MKSKKYKRKKIFLAISLLMLSLVATNFEGFWSQNNGFDELDELARTAMLPIPISGMGKGKVRFTKVGKEVFAAFLKVNDNNMTVVRKLLEVHAGSKFYHLYSAYCYGFYLWKQTSNPYEKEKIKRVVWNIAMEFSQQNRPRWKDYFMQLGPSFVWTSIAVVTLLWGSYLRKNNKRFFETYSDKIFDWAKHLIFRFINGKTSKPT